MFQKCSDNKNFLDNRDIRILSSFFPQSPKTSWRNLSVFQKCSDKKNFGLWGFQDFVSIFCLTVPENFGEEHFCVALMFWYQIFMDNRGIRILSNFFVSQCQKTSRRNPYVFQKFSGIKNFLGNRVIRILSFFVSQCRKNSWRNRSIFQKFSGIETS